MDATWLATEAKTLHQIFENVFYVMVTTFLILSVTLEYFKLPLGGMPQISQLVGRAFIACILMTATPEIMSLLASFTDGIVSEVGKFTEFKLVMEKLGSKIHDLSWSWLSVKDSVMIAISYVSYFGLYVLVYFADAAFLLCWMMLYVFSPILTALYVFPMTAGSTTALFKSMIEVCAWKIVGSCMSALLWSMALSQINKPEYNVSFLTVIILNLMLALSVFKTPQIVAGFLSGSISGLGSGLSRELASFTGLTPESQMQKAKNAASSVGSKSRQAFFGDGSPSSRSGMAKVNPDRFRRGETPSTNDRDSI